MHFVIYLYIVSIPCSPPLVPVLKEIIQSIIYHSYCNKTNFNIIIVTMLLTCNWPNSSKVIPVHNLSTTRGTCYIHLITLDLIFLIYVQCQSRWSCCLMPKSVAAGLRASWVRIPMRVWIFISYVCCVGSGLCDRLTARSEQSHRMCVSSYCA